MGTCHVERGSDLLTTAARAVATPLGEVPVDTEAVARATSLPQVSVDDWAHEADHSLAVQLPFLQLTLTGFQIVPLLVQTVDAEHVTELLELLWGGDETLIVVSSDLSHHLSYDQAQQRDGQTACAICALEVEAIDRESACGHRAIAGLVVAARRLRLRACQLDLRNSGDTSGRRGAVVGYGAFGFESDDNHES
jgi:AmmeMemoRadiSam system protein B